MEVTMDKMSNVDATIKDAVHYAAHCKCADKERLRLPVNIDLCPCRCPVAVAVQYARA
jgi:hypothetical protein